MSVTFGCIPTIFNGTVVPDAVVQVVQIKKLSAASGQQAAADRFRVLLSDGTHFQQSMLTSQMNALVTSGNLTEMSLVRLKEYAVRELKGHRIIIAVRMEVVSGPVAKIGEPVNVEDMAPSADIKPAVTAAPPAPAAAVARPIAPPASAAAAASTAAAPVAYGKPAPASATPAGNGGVQYGSTAARGGGGGGGGGAAVARPVVGGAPAGTGTGMYATSAATARTAVYGQGPTVRHEDQAYVPISALNPYQNKWIIKGRVTDKSKIRTWQNDRGEGKLFSMTIVDEEGTDMRATFFRDAVDRFFDAITVGRVYSISRGRLKPTSGKFGNTASSYELTLGADAEITELPDDRSIKSNVFHFVPIERMASVEPGTVVDVLGVVQSFTPAQPLTSKAGRELVKRDLDIVDSSKAAIRLTLWGEQAQMPDSTFEGNPVVAVKSAKVGDFGGRSLSTLPGSALEFNPDQPAVASLRTWFDTQGHSTAVNSLTSGGGRGIGARGRLSERKSIEDIRTEGLGSTKPDFIHVKGTITHIKHDLDPGPWYPACPGINPASQRPCNKKLIDELGTGEWRCEKCATTYPQPSLRYIVSMVLMDTTGSQWVTMFHEQAMQLLRVSAEELNELKSSNPAEYEAVFARANFSTLVSKLRVQLEQSNEATRLRCTVVDSRPIDYVAESKDLITAIENWQ